MTDGRERAAQPEDITRLVYERANAGDAEGIAALYEPAAVLALPPGQMTVGREAIRAVFEQLLAHSPDFRPEEPLPALRIGDLASSRPARAMRRAPMRRWRAGSPTGHGCGSWTGPISAPDCGWGRGSP